MKVANVTQLSSVHIRMDIMIISLVVKRREKIILRLNHFCFKNQYGICDWTTTLHHIYLFLS